MIQGLFEDLLQQVDMQIQNAAMSMPNTGRGKDIEWYIDLQESLEMLIDERANLIKRYDEQRRNKGKR